MDGNKYNCMNITVNRERIENNLKQLSQFGKKESGGIDRSFGSEADVMARKWLINQWNKDLNCPVYIDSIANIWVTREGSEKLKPIVLGSHHDSVKNGGMYDGAMGIIIGAEVLQRLKENNCVLRHPIALVSFSAEEPNPFNLSTLGSRTAVGKLSKTQIEEAFDAERKLALEEAIKIVGGDVKKLGKAMLNAGDFAAFLECHIEQGRNLYDKGLSIGVVTKVTGIYREKISVIGESNHAGTTVMEYRHDALMAASELCLGFEKIIKEAQRKDVVGTVGWFKVEPNSVNIIPGQANLIIELRAPNCTIKDEILKKLLYFIDDIVTKRKVKILRTIVLDQKEVNFDATVINALKDTAKAMDEEFLELVSMAGHDSVHMTDIGRTGMLFVQSIEGKSHCKEEKTNMIDIEKAGNLLLNAVLKLDKELD